MKSSIFISLSLIILLFLSALSTAHTDDLMTHQHTPPSQASSFNNTASDSYYALIIGIEQHVTALFPEEECIDESADDIYHGLLQGHNWKEDHVRLLINENATKQAIHRTIVDWLDPLEQEEDIVLIYFIGHAQKLSMQQRSMGDGYFLPYDTTSIEYSSNAITDIELNAWLQTLDSTHMTIMLDTSYSGVMHALNQQGRTVIGSTNALIQLQDTSQHGLGHTIFSHFIIKGLKGHADENEDGYISTQELYQYAKTQSIEYSIDTTLEAISDFRFNVTLQLPSIINRHRNPMQLYTIPFGWRQLTDDGFGKNSNYATRGLAVFNGELYIGTQNNLIPQHPHTEEQKMILATATLFPDIYEIFGPLSTIPQRIIMHLMTFASQGCEIWKYNYTTDSISKVIGSGSISGVPAGFGSHFNAAAAVLKVFNGYLYVGTWNTPLGSVKEPNRKGCEIWRTADGLQWEQVVGHQAPITKGGFGNPDNTGAWSIETFNDSLYVGTMNWDFSKQGGCEIWRSNDGIHWEQVMAHGFKSLMNPEERQSINTYAWILKEYKDHLYLGTFNSRIWLFNEEGTGCQLWRTANGTDWEKVLLPDGITGESQDGFGEGENYGIRRMVIYNDDLYVGIASSFFHTHGCEIWRYDGTTWTSVIGDDVPGITPEDQCYDGFGNPMNKYIWSMCVTNDNKLWVGTANAQVYHPFFMLGGKNRPLFGADTEGCEIWCYDGDNWEPVIKNEFGLKPSGMGDIANLGARSMIEYPIGSGNIIVGTFKLFNPNPSQPREGCELWMRFNYIDEAT